MGNVTLKGAQVKQVAAAPPAQAAAKTAAAPALAKKTVDWKLECAHHGSDGSRPIFERANQIELVPDKSKTSEKIKISYKNEETAPPDKLDIGGTSIRKGGSAGKYATYEFDAEYNGNLEEQRFWTPDFWKFWREVSTYRVANAPLPIEIRVRHPSRYKLEVQFPALKGYKAGQKLSQRNYEDTKFGKSKVEIKEEVSGWSPSRLKSTTKEVKQKGEWNKAGDRFHLDKKKHRKTTKEDEAPAVAFTVDGWEANLKAFQVLESLASLKKFADALGKIVKTFRESAPQVGWYVEYDLQLLQGTIAVEWNWQEAHDHTAFKYVDVSAQMTFLSLTLEAGMGISGVGCKAQVYVQLAGTVDVTVSGRRERPDMVPGATIPVRTELCGTIGARFEAGSYVKASATGKTGLELKVDIGINRADREAVFTIDTSGEWTGLEVAITASAGAFGIGGKKSWKKTLAEREKLFDDIQWPSDKKYQPPVVSRDRIRAVLREKLTKGFDVKIATTLHKYWLNDYLDLSRVLDRLMVTIDKHEDFDRSPEAVEGLASGIRGDLDDIAKKNKERFLLESQFEDYAKNQLEGRLDSMIPPSKALDAPPRTSTAVA